MTNIEQLQRLSSKLSGLMEDPQPGLMSWNEFLNETLHGIASFVVQPEVVLADQDGLTETGRYIAACETDSERMNWIESHRATVYRGMEQSYWVVVDETLRERKGNVQKSLRAAIDEARGKLDMNSDK